MEKRSLKAPMYVFMFAFVVRVLMEVAGFMTPIAPDAQTLSFGLFAGVFTSVSALIVLAYARFYRPELLLHALALTSGYAIGGRLTELSIGYSPAFELVYFLVQIAIMIAMYQFFAKSLRNGSAHKDPDRGTDGT